VFKIHVNSFIQFAKQKKKLDQAISNHKAYLKKNGVPQVDYILGRQAYNAHAPLVKFKKIVNMVIMFNKSNKKQSELLGLVASMQNQMKEAETKLSWDEELIKTMPI
jgi:hypothetical protein